MSFMARVRVAIKNLDVFKQMCEKHHVGVSEGHGQHEGSNIVLELKDQLNTDEYQTQTLVVKDSEDQQAHNLVIDNDVNYCSLSRRLGQNGGILMRDYAEEIFNQELLQQGAMVTERELQKDKSIRLRVSFPQ